MFAIIAFYLGNGTR